MTWPCPIFSILTQENRFKSVRDYKVLTFLPAVGEQVLMRREMRSLKAQMQEMAAMLKTCLDMQLETQRAIRQEVAAALAQQGTLSLLVAVIVVCKSNFPASIYGITYYL
jgi:hypothetical protein